MVSLYRRYPQALPPADVAALRDRLLAHPLVGDSQLVGMFQGSRGFGVAFRQDARPRVLERLPVLAPFFALLDAHPPERGLLDALRRRPPINACYLNVLVLDDGRGVGEHTDGTLQEPAGAPGAVPEVVSVLYLQVPPRRSGGTLTLLPPGAPAVLLEPEEGTFLSFRGDVPHEVGALEGAVGPRVSLVCEQYAFPPEALARLAPMTVQSRAPDPVFANPRGKPFASLLTPRDPGPRRDG